MGRRIRELKKSPNLALTFVLFLIIAAAGFAYLHVKKPALNINIDVAIVVSSICGLEALFFFCRSIRKRPKLPQEQKGFH